MSLKEKSKISLKKKEIKKKKAISYLHASVVAASKGVVIFEAFILKIDDSQAPMVPHMHRHNNFIHSKYIHPPRPASYSRIIVFSVIHKQRIKKGIEKMTFGSSGTQLGISLFQKFDVKIDNLLELFEELGFRLLIIHLRLPRRSATLCLANGERQTSSNQYCRR